MRSPRPRAAMSAMSFALGVATGISLRTVDPLLPAIAAIALAVPIGAVIALLRREPI